MSFNLSPIERLTSVWQRVASSRSVLWITTITSSVTCVALLDCTIAIQLAKAQQFNSIENIKIQISKSKFLESSSNKAPAAISVPEWVPSARLRFPENQLEDFRIQEDVTLGTDCKTSLARCGGLNLNDRNSGRIVEQPGIKSVSINSKFLPGLTQTVASAKSPDSDSVTQSISAELAATQLTSTQLASTQLAQTRQNESSRSSEKILKEGSLVLGSPYVRFQGAYVLQGDDSSARARLTGLYPVLPNLLFGAEVDLTTGNAFTDSPGTGLRLNELYVAYSPPNVPNLRFVGGLMDLTSYFDRNSFAKDGTTHFFNPVFQTNPALSAANIASRPGFLVNWSATDNLELKAATFSASRNLGDFAINSFAGEVGVRFGTAIIRGTYVTTKDNGRRTGFDEIFSIPRSNGDFGFRFGDREQAFGINAEYYIPSIRMGLFGRYGWYENLSLGRSGDTFSVGLNFLDLFMPNDRLGIGYGRQLSNSDLRRQLGDKVPDVLELFYDVQVLPNLRAGVTFQERNQFSETIFGFRLKTEFDVVPFRRPFR